MSQVIEIKDIGPIEHLEIRPPETGGVLVFHGQNGAGKSTAVNALQSIIDGKTRLPKRDGAARGVVDGCGVLISVSGRTMRNGELSVESIEGKYDINKLVDPGIDKPESADAERIKNLLRLTGVKADKSLFDEAVGGEASWAAHIKPDATATDDLVLMAARIKRDLQEQARGQDRQAENYEKDAAAKKSGAEDAPLDETASEEELTDALQKASAHLAKLKEIRDHELRILRDRDQAKLMLEQATREYSGKTVEEARGLQHDAMERARQAEREVDQLTEQLKAAEQRLKEASTDVRHTSDLLAAAQRHESTVAAWREQIEPSCQNVIPTNEDIAQAEVALTNARGRLARAATAAQARAKLAEAEDLAAKAKALRREAESFRGQAGMVDQVLSRAVACPSIEVEGGRLFVRSDRGKELFAELSPGERAELAICDVAIPALQKLVEPGRMALLPISQELWAALDHERKQRLRGALAGTGIVAVTAECDEGPLRVEEFRE